MTKLLTTTEKALNEDIELFDAVFPITADMCITHEGVSRLIMLDRYSFKDTKKTTLRFGDLVVLTVKSDPKFPARGIGQFMSQANGIATIKLEELYSQYGDEHGNIEVPLSVVDKPLEVFYEQIALRNAYGLSRVEGTEERREQSFKEFYEVLSQMDFIPAGRVMYGAGSGTDVTFFNCYVMPYPKDSREGIGQHRNEVMEIMSRGGGVGTNGSTLRPRNALARGVNGRSSGSVSWLNDIAQLTHLVEQGGSRRGAQMIILADWHPDILAFIISKVQNPKVLRFIIETTQDDEIRTLAQQKLKFTPLTEIEVLSLQLAVAYVDDLDEIGVILSPEELAVRRHTSDLIRDGGRYSVHDADFLTGANISVGITKEFMQAVEDDTDYALRFPDVENYDADDMTAYDEKWHEHGDVRTWEEQGFAVKTYRTVRAKALWDLINICATYSAEPGIFFLDNANEATNAVAYGQKVVATNPCGEQPLAPYSVCNLAAVNLANHVNKETKEVDYEKLAHTVRIGIRMQDNVIDSTPYFLEANKVQALGERRIGLGVMGLADLLIYCEKAYGSDEGNVIVDKVFEVIATESYRASIDLAKEKGSFPFLDGHDVIDQEIRRSRFINSGFMQTMPEDIRGGILKYGIRNSHLLTVAPTGSTGSMVGVSTGLEPYFAFKYYRSGRLGKFMEVNAGIVQEYLDANPHASSDDLPEFFVSTMDLAPEAHVDVQCIIQRWVDSSLSKTVNAPKGYTVAQVQSVYERLYNGGAKGGTVYVDGSRDAQVLTLSAEENDTADVVAESPKVVMVDTINELRSTDVEYGSEVGDTCPLCRIGTVEDLGGCNTCTNCNAQLRCGL